ncbi:MAG TPA: hypothetical protein VE621_20855 [Bryobacteraceae bacterium]|nr:hypothetical protein [Bryobacteraceae bacterium]
MAKIAGALVAIGPERGGVFAPPLTIEGLAEAIKSFQEFQKLPVRDGRVDRGGGTLKRINAILNGIAPIPPPTPPPTPVNTGAILPLQTGLPAQVDKNTWSPVESSLITEMVFKWTGIQGKGKIFYFQLNENVVPRWYGVLVPDGATFDKAHIFFHPTPGQAGYDDRQYQTLGNWVNVWHYLTDDFGSQFCAAARGWVLFMPLMTNGVFGTCGIFPRRWESIVSQIFGMIKSNNMTASADPVSIQKVIVSSFSSGIAYSHVFRANAGLGARLSGVIDFDGGISSFPQLSAAIKAPAGRIVRMQQMPTTQSALSLLAANNTFPLGQPRWGGPYANLFSKNPKDAVLQIHGTIPQTTMFIAAGRLH